MPSSPAKGTQSMLPRLSGSVGGMKLLPKPSQPNFTDITIPQAKTAIDLTPHGDLREDPIPSLTVQTLPNLDTSGGLLIGVGMPLPILMGLWIVVDLPTLSSF